MPLVSGLLRVLTPRDLPGLRELIDRNPVRHCFVDSRLQAGGVDPWHLQGEMWGWIENDRLVSALFSGANLVPVEATPEALRAFADRGRRLGRRCSSLVGPADEVMDLWRLLESSWGPAREIRSAQPVMVCDGPPTVAEDPLVRVVREDELDILLPACIDMFTEEVGVSPVASGAGPTYRSRIKEIVTARQAFARIEGGRIIFKAEVGAVSASVCQVQGVWVPPDLRGKGLSAPGMATVVRLAQETLAPIVSLYVNDFNDAARRSYERVGFRQVDTFATILF